MCQQLIDIKNDKRLTAASDVTSLPKKEDTLFASAPSRLDAASKVTPVWVKEKVEALESSDDEQFRAAGRVSYAPLKANTFELSDHERPSASCHTDSVQVKLKKDTLTSSGPKRLAGARNIASVHETQDILESSNYERLDAPANVDSFQVTKYTLESSPHGQLDTPCKVAPVTAKKDKLTQSHQKGQSAPSKVASVPVKENAFQSSDGTGVDQGYTYHHANIAAEKEETQQSKGNMTPSNDMSQRKANGNEHPLNHCGTELHTASSEDDFGELHGLGGIFASKTSFGTMPADTDRSPMLATSDSETDRSFNHGENNEQIVSPEGVFGGLQELRGQFGSETSLENMHRSTDRSQRIETSDGQLYGFDQELFGGDSDLNYDDIPAFDDIPYAMLLCSVFNEKEIEIAIAKQDQKRIVYDIERQHSQAIDVDPKETMNHHTVPHSKNRKKRGQIQDVPLQPDSGKMVTPDLTDKTDTHNCDPLGVLNDQIPDQCTDENKTYKGRNFTDLQLEVREKRIQRFAKTENTQQISYDKQFPQNSLLLQMPDNGKSFNQTKEGILSLTFQPYSSSNEYGIQSKSTSDESLIQVSPTLSSSMDSIWQSSHLDSNSQPSHAQRTVLSDKWNKEETKPRYTDTTMPVDNNDTNDATETVHSQGLTTNISDALEDFSSTDDEDDIFESDLPTAMKALFMSQEKSRSEKKHNDVELNSVFTPKQKSTKRRPNSVSNQSKKKLSSKALSMQSTDLLKHENQNDNGVHLKEKPEFMLKAERQMSETAKTYARAFDGLRKLQSSKKIKCIACGNPDCQGDFVQSIQGLMHEARKQGLKVVDVAPDGNCMFTAVCDHLQAYTDYSYTARTLRETAVFWLQDHPYCSDDSNTHFQAFMEENWDSYLHRMIKDGEWGDHVILRAVANVTGCTIKVLNVRGKTSTWTSVEPSLEQPAEGRRVILLGHVGESHYTSLRHSETPDKDSSVNHKEDTSVTSSEQAMSEEDRSTVAVFMKDQVDCKSKVPVCCLSFLMTSVLPSKTLVDVAARSSSISLLHWTEIAEKWQPYGPSYIPTIIGCIADGVYNMHLCNSDNPNVFYIWIDLKIFYVCPNEKQVVRWRLAGHGTLCSVGYTHIINNENEKVSSERYSSYNFNIPVSGGGQISAVYVIHWPYWPQEASEWISRVRYAGWPLEEVIHDICSKGCHLIPEAHVSSADSYVEWMFSFADAQTKLFRNAVSVDQKYCFLVAYGMCFEVLNDLLFFKLEWIINPFLYCCERCPSEFWQSNCASCVIMIIDEILRCFTSKCLPNYFIPSWNLIETLEVVNISAVVGCLETVRAEPIVVLRQMHEDISALPQAENIFAKISLAAEEFLSTKVSTLNVFVPCMIDSVKHYINSGFYDIALESLNEAYQTRLSVATCEDAMSYENFIQGCCSGLNTFQTAWFATFVDKQLQGQLSRPLIQLVLEGRTMKRIDEILDKDISGYYGSSEVPVSLANQFDSFCHDYAVFLVFVNKASDALPILYHCHKRCQEYLKTGGDVYFSDETMLAVYAGIFALHKRQQQTAVFREILEDASSVVHRVNQPRGYGWLAYVHRMFKDESGAKANAAKRDELLRQMSAGDVSGIDAASLIHWPSKYLM